MLNRFCGSHRKSLGHGSTVILIKEAAEGDNDALNELQKKCPMGTSMRALYTTSSSVIRSIE
jgi:hypothetical protein